MDTSSSILQIFNESDEEIPLTLTSAESILSSISKNEEASFEMIELVYVDEEEIVRINQEHLGRDYVTDIISFRYDSDQKENENTSIEGTLYCCAPRIIEQAKEFNESKEQEFKRIFIHGLLHLAGYEDNTPDKKKHMTSLENKYLSMDKG